MKISYYELLKMMKEGNAPKKVKYMQMIFLGNNENYDFEDDNGEIHFLSDYLTMDEMYKYDEIEILDDEEKKFTKEDFIKERIDLDGITREQFDERYEVKECNCGMPYCKGFRAIEKKEKGLPEKLTQFEAPFLKGDKPDIRFSLIIDNLNEIIDYLEKQRKGE